MEEDTYRHSGKIFLMIPFDIAHEKVEQSLNALLETKDWKKVDFHLQNMFFEDEFINFFQKSELFLSNCLPIRENNRDYLFTLYLHKHLYQTLLLIVTIDFTDEPTDNLIRMTRFHVPGALKVDSRKPITHVGHILDTLIGEGNPLREVYESKPVYPFKMIYLKRIANNSGETIDFKNGRELVDTHENLVYGLFHADTHWRENNIHKEDLMNSFRDTGSSNIICFPNYGWYFGALTLISREVMLFFNKNFDSYVEETLLPVIESVLVREMVLARFEKEMTGIVKKLYATADRLIPFLNYIKLRSLQKRSITYYTSIKSLAEERNFRWFTEIDIFRAVCRTRYIEKTEEHVLQMLEKLENFISSESNLTTELWLFVLTLISIIPIIIEYVLPLLIPGGP